MKFHINAFLKRFKIKYKDIKIRVNKLQSYKDKLTSQISKYSLFQETESLEGVQKNIAIKKNNKIKKRILFLAFVILYFFYVYKIFRPRFLVSSAFVIKTTSSNSSPEINFPLISGNNNDVSVSDARYIKTFLHSPQLYKEVDKKLNFTKKYEKRFPDFFSGINKNTPFEKKLKFYRKNVKLKLDEVSGELFIDTYAFDPETSFAINNYLLKSSEKFINEFNKKISIKQFNFFSKEVENAYRKLWIVQKKLEKFQTKNLLLDGFEELKASNLIINGLESELIRLKIELATIQREFVDNEAPEIISLNNQISEIKKQVKIEKELLYNNSGKELNAKAIELKNIKSELNFKNDLYNSALSVQEKSRIDTINQKRFITNLLDPFIPEEQDFSIKNRLFISSLILIFVIYFLYKFVFGSIKSDSFK